jgi:hypothetical protein
MLTQEFQWFDTFRNLLLHDEGTPPPTGPEDNNLLINSRDFQNFVLETQGKTLDVVKLLAPHFKRYACRPFQLLYDHPEFYIAFDCTAYTYYVSFKNLTMIDVDMPDENKHGATNDKTDNNATKNDDMVLDYCSKYLEWLVTECEKHRDWRFAIYRTRNGLHVFPLHARFYGDQRAEFQLQLKCDFYYTIFCYVRRDCPIRINKKRGETAPIYRFVGFLGYGNADAHILNLVKFHEDLPSLYGGGVLTDALPLWTASTLASPHEING